METKTTLIKNGTLISPISEYKNPVILHKNASILIENDKIAEIGEVSKIGSNISETNVDKVITGENKIIMPSLINTHTHVSMSLLRGLADDLELDTWLNDHIWPMEAKLDGELVYLGGLLSIVEMIKSGCTCFNDMYFFIEDLTKAVDESGTRGCLSYGMLDFGDEEKRNNELKESENIIKYIKNLKNERIKGYLGPHSPITASQDLLEESRKIANKRDVGIHIHISETKKELDDVIESKGKRPFEYLDDIGFLDEDVVAAHSVWLSDREIDIVKEKDVKISHNPVSNMKLSSGIGPISKMLEKNVCVSLGTDGSASNNNLDLFEEMKFASLLQKVSTLNPKILNAEETIKLATINGAKALGLEDEIGSIEEGKKADIILIDTTSPNMTPNTNSLISHIVYAANGSNVDTTICNGEILMENKILTKLNEREIIEKANIINQKLKE